MSIMEFSPLPFLEWQFVVVWEYDEKIWSGTYYYTAGESKLLEYLPTEDDWYTVNPNNTYWLNNLMDTDQYKITTLQKK